MMTEDEVIDRAAAHDIGQGWQCLFLWEEDLPIGGGAIVGPSNKS
jgi:hypothetical protein